MKTKTIVKAAIIVSVAIVKATILQPLQKSLQLYLIHQNLYFRYQIFLSNLLLFFKMIVYFVAIVYEFK